MHQIARIYMVVPQQKWNNTYLQAAEKLEGKIIAKIVFNMKSLKELKRIGIFFK